MELRSERLEGSLVPRTRSRLQGQFIRLCLFFFSSVFGPSPSLNAEPLPCLGYDSESAKWGAQLRPYAQLCPKNHAYFGTSKPIDFRPAEIDFTVGICCPLPEADILSQTQMFLQDQCPDKFVVTGKRVQRFSDGGFFTEYRCTEINTTRYTLGEVRPGVLWGVDVASGPYFWKESQHIRASALPPALRIGLSRHDFQEFSLNGCVGYPFGSLVVGKNGRRCKSIKFRQLQYLGIGDDPIAGTPVQMYPECRYISDPFSTNGVCVN